MGIEDVGGRAAKDGPLWAVRDTIIEKGRRTARIGHRHYLRTGWKHE